MLILSGGINKGSGNTVTSARGGNNNQRLSSLGAATISQISAQAKQVTAQSQKAISSAKGKIATATNIKGQLSKAMSALKGSSLSGFGNYGEVSMADLKRELETKKRAIVQTKQVIATAKQAIRK